MTFENYENLCISPLIFKMKYNDSNLTPFFLVKKYWKYYTDQDRWEFWSNAFNPMLIYV